MPCELLDIRVCPYKSLLTAPSISSIIHAHQPKRTRKMNQVQLDASFLAFAAEVDMVMDSDEDRADYAARGHLHTDPGSDVHDFEGRP